MSRFLFLLCVVAAVGGSGCAVGVRQPATDITKTSALLRGNAVSTEGGAGSYYFEYSRGGAKQTTPARPIEFTAGDSQPVSEPVTGLDAGRVYEFKTCAEDSENPGSPFCSPPARFETDTDITLELTPDCDSYPTYHGIRAAARGLPPNEEFTGTIDSPSYEPWSQTVTAGTTGSYGVSFLGDEEPGLFVITVDSPLGGRVTESIFVDCTPTS